MAAGSKKGERRGGRKPGAKNKATIERETRAMQELVDQAKAATAANKKIVMAKDELLELIPVVKGTVAQFQQAAIAGGEGLPGQKGYDRQKWVDLKDWLVVLENICRHAAEFQSPKFRAIAVAMQDPGARQPQPAVIEAKPTDKEGRERAASAAYLKLVSG